MEEEFGEKCNSLYWQISSDQMKGGFRNFNLKAASTTRSTATTTTSTTTTTTTTTKTLTTTFFFQHIFTAIKRNFVSLHFHKMGE